MWKIHCIIISIVSMLPGFSSILTYQIPDLTLETFNDGYSVSIPAEPDVKRVAFNINRNKPFTTFEEGDYSGQIRSPIDNRFAFKIQKTLNVDDILYIWISVQYKNLVYRKIYEGISVREHTAHRVSSPSSSIPEVTVKPIFIEPHISIQNENNNSNSNNNNPNCERAITKMTLKGQRQIVKCRGDIIFNENFDSPLDNEIWKTEVRLPSPFCEDEFVVYNTSCVAIENGLLQIRAYPWNNNAPDTKIRQGLLDLGEKCTETSREYCRRQPMGALILPPVVSGRLNTKSGFSFQYGRIVIRAKFPQGNWLYPLMYLEPVAILFNDPLPCFHARIAFVRGNRNLINFENFQNLGGNRLSGGAIFVASAGTRDQFTVNKTSEWSFTDDFHIYEMIWNEQFLIFKVDNEEYGRINVDELTYTGNMRREMTRDAKSSMQREFALTFGVAAGGHADFPDGDFNKPWNNTAPKALLHFWQKRLDWINTWTDPVLKIDYVRVYAI